MKVLFGQSLDGCPAPSHWMGIGHLVCGPSGLLGALEVSLGIPPLEGASDLARLISYREAAQAWIARSGDAFFRASFEAENLSTSRVLLHWRDELRLAGWSLVLEVEDDAPPRLRDLAGIEAIASPEAVFRFGMAERIERILAALALGENPGLESITVLDFPEALPTLWRRLLDRLGATYDSQLPDRALAPEGTALHELQKRLLETEGLSPGSKIAGDDSVVLLRDFSEVGLSRATARVIGDLPDPADGVLIASADSLPRLNDALVHLDLPRFAAREGTTAGSLSQLLPLALRLHWLPFDPQAWLEFLLHPVCPVPGKVRFRLANAIHDRPGRENAPWREAIARAREGASSDATLAARIERAVADWVNLPGHRREEGLPGTSIAATCRKLSEWMRSVFTAKKISGDEEAADWFSLAGATEAFGEACASLATVSPIELERLVAAWLPTAGVAGRTPGEMGGPLAVSCPDQVLEPVPRLLWWQPTGSTARRSAWTQRERDWLAAQGADLVSSQSELEASEGAAHRALLYATESVTLFVSTGETNEPGSPVVTRIEAELASGTIREASTLVRKEPVPVVPLPEPRRWWRLSEGGLLGPRERESYSSLSKVIFSPYQWVFSYRARLAGGSLTGFRVLDDAARRGTVLHDLAGALFAPEAESPIPAVDWTRLDESRLHGWIERAWPLLLEDRAAHYLAPGFESARKSLLHTARSGLWRLVQNLQEAGVTEVEVEKFLSAVPFAGGEISGRIDLIVRSPDAVAVVDMKLGGHNPRQLELAENRHLQLAIYGHLLGSTEEMDPSVAYFILAKGALFARSKTFFPGATTVSLKNPDDASEWQGCWREFEQIWHWRRAQLDSGLIEVTVAGTESDSPAPLEHWSAREGADYYNDFDALTGWPRNS
ncbi:MAG: PD-(D/E)XK nuclease family protein [Verrucomicrobiaceae bacterium]|nr:PD-(D/E)XK nuclease family protein [Verrucomicrobiaceae bacterium]